MNVEKQVMKQLMRTSAIALLVLGLVLFAGCVQEKEAELSFTSSHVLAAPEVMSTVPTDIYHTDDLELSGTCVAGTDEIKLYVNGSYEKSASCVDEAFSVSLSRSRNGFYRLKLIGVHTLVQAESNEYIWVRDYAAPLKPEILTASASNSADAFDVQVACLPDALFPGETTVALYVNGVKEAEKDCPSNFLLNFKVERSVDGVYRLNARSNDPAQNFSAVSNTGAERVVWQRQTGIPNVVRVLSPMTGDPPFTTSDTIAFRVQFDEIVFVSGTPTLLVETGDTDRLANYVAGSGTNTLTFVYTVVAGDSSDDLDYAGVDALTTDASNTIQDAGGNDALTALPAPGSEGSVSNGAGDIVVSTP